MGATPRHNIHFAEQGDAVNFAGDQQLLADSVDKAIPVIHTGTGPPPAKVGDDGDWYLQYT